MERNPWMDRGGGSPGRRDGSPGRSRHTVHRHAARGIGGAFDDESDSALGFAAVQSDPVMQALRSGGPNMVPHAEARARELMEGLRSSRQNEQAAAREVPTPPSPKQTTQTPKAPKSAWHM